MEFTGLRGNEMLIIEIPAPLEKSEYTMVNMSNPNDAVEKYAIEFKGNTALSVQRVVPDTKQNEYYAGNQDHDWYRIFRRDALRNRFLEPRSQ